MNKKEKIETTREKKVKRLKTHHARPNIESLTPIDTDCFKLEEQFDIDDCYERFLETSGKLQEYLNLIMLSKKGEKTKESVDDYKLRVSMLMVCLKKLNRLDKHQWKKSRDKVNERKQIVDAMHLQYQNLLYEATHLQKEVNKCLEFRSKDEEIELVPVEEFYKDAPETISKPESTKNNEHELMLARLLWETEQRKRFAILLKEAEIKKHKYTQSIQKLQENLGNILPTIKSIISAAEPFSGQMGMPFQKMEPKHKICKYLPRPLYTLYVQICAFQEHSNSETIQVNIEGNIDDAKAIDSKPEDFSDDSGESDVEESNEINTHRHKNLQKKKTVSRDVLTKHPMSIVISIDKEFKLVLVFQYMVSLRVVTVTVRSLDPEPMSTDVIGDILHPATILSCLFPDDFGHDSPNLSNIYELESNLGLDNKPFSNDTTGLPYLWAQKLAGLEFLQPGVFENKSRDNVYKHIPACVKKTFTAVYDRLNARHHLYDQIVGLDQKINIPPEFAALYSASISSQLKSWKPSTWKEVLNHPNAAHLQDLGLVNEDSLVYKAEILRSSALLSVSVIVPPEYPVKTPVFLLELFWKGSHNAVAKSPLREIEEEVNIHFVSSLPPQFKDYLLSCQLYHLTVCFDVFLETRFSEDSFEGPHEFMREKVVVRYARGPSRSTPYRCISSQGIFTYR